MSFLLFRSRHRKVALVILFLSALSLASRMATALRSTPITCLCTAAQQAAASGGQHSHAGHIPSMASQAQPNGSCAAAKVQQCVCSALCQPCTMQVS